MTRRYPLETLRKVRLDQVEERRREVAERLVTEREAETRRQQAEELRRDEERRTRAVLDGEAHRLESGALSVGDLQQGTSFRLGAELRDRQLAASEQRAAAAVRAAQEQVAAANVRLAAADADAKAVQRHKQRFDHEAAERAEQAQEEAALDAHGARAARGKS